MSSLGRISALTLCAALGGGQALAASPAPKVEVNVVTERDKLVPGQPMWIGVRYAIEPGWHIYWENPGESGMSTLVELKPGPGLVAGPVQYPGPDRFDLPGGIANFGYHDEVYLLAQLTPRAQVAAGEHMKVDWSTSWLACKEACIQGSAKGTLDLVVGTAVTSNRSTLLAPWVARLPVSVTNVVGEERWAGTAAAPQRIVHIPGATKALFFPASSLVNALPAQRVEPDARGVLLTLTLDPVQLPADARGVLRVESSDGPQWIEIRVPRPPANLP